MVEKASSKALNPHHHIVLEALNLGSLLVCCTLVCCVCLIIICPVVSSGLDVIKFLFVLEQTEFSSSLLQTLGFVLKNSQWSHKVLFIPVHGLITYFWNKFLPLKS